MVVNREREIREFVKIPFYRILLQVAIEGHECTFEWKATEESKYYQSPKIYKDNGFLEEKEADAFIRAAYEDGSINALAEKYGIGNAVLD